MSSWHSYPSIYNFGHSAIAGLLDVPVYVEEKVDGSQFSFGKFNGELRVRSKGKEMPVDHPEKMFARGVETVKAIEHLLVDGFTYRGEYFQKPKHNTLAYDRVPNGHIILFDVSPAEETYLLPSQKAAEAARLGLESVPVLWSGSEPLTLETFQELLKTTSVLGGQLVEGVVVKQVTPILFGPDKKALIGKFVSEAFREIHKKSWKAENPSGADILSLLANQYRTPARWQKAIQHLREAGQIEDSPKDIGVLLKEIEADLLKECREEIVAALFKWGWPNIRRGVTKGFPEWYKDQLLKSQFKEAA